MAIALESLAKCFQGIIPAWLFSCSKDGIPNTAILSHVDYVDPRHVALSFQFFNKSRRNIAENPQALVRLYDPDTMQAYLFRLRYVRSDFDGPTFDSMRLRIEAIASYSGLKGIFKLIAADIYEVLSVEAAEDEVGAPVAAAAHVAAGQTASVPFTMRALGDMLDRIRRAASLERLLDSILEGLDTHFGFAHSMILLSGEQPDVLVTLASRGYARRGVGAEVRFGEGIVGMVAEARKPIRISGMLRQMLYAHAVAMQAREQGLCGGERRIALPGLEHPESQLGIPLLVRDELVGVLCIESDRPYRFHEEDKSFLEVLGGYLALAIQNTLYRERTEEGAELEPHEPPPAAQASAQAAAQASAQASTHTAAAGGKRRIEVAFYRGDECILVDGEYLVRSLPARILWKLLREHDDTGRCEFTNRQLRLDKSLALPEYKDNLESRLILLRRRLEERCPDLRLTPAGRGRFRVEIASELALVEHP